MKIKNKSVLLAISAGALAGLHACVALPRVVEVHSDSGITTVEPGRVILRSGPTDRGMAGAYKACAVEDAMLATERAELEKRTTELADIRSELERRSKRIDATHSELDAERAELARRTAELEQFRVELTETQLRTDHATALAGSALEAERQEVVEQRRRIEATHAELTQRAADLEQQHSALVQQEAEIGETRAAAIAELDAERGALKEQKKLVLAELNWSRDELEQRQARMDASEASRTAEVKQERSALATEWRECNAQKVALAQGAAALEKLRAEIELDEKDVSAPVVLGKRKRLPFKTSMSSDARVELPSDVEPHVVNSEKKSDLATRDAPGTPVGFSPSSWSLVFGAAALSVLVFAVWMARSCRSRTACPLTVVFTSSGDEEEERRRHITLDVGDAIGLTDVAADESTQNVRPRSLVVGPAFINSRGQLLIDPNGGNDIEVNAIVCTTPVRLVSGDEVCAFGRMILIEAAEPYREVEITDAVPAAA